MRIRTRRFGGLLVAVALVAALVAGCGSSSGNSGAATHGSSANAVDRAFVRQMIPHHEMAVQMAQMARRHGRHEQMKKLAHGIIAAQSREIGELTGIAAKLGVTPGSSGGMHMGHGSTPGMDGEMSADARTLGLPMEQMGMSMDMSMLATARPFDRAFIDMMIPHHQGAIRMARAELARGGDAQLRRIAQGIIADQAGEIGEMNAWRKQWFGAVSPAGAVPGA